MHRHLDAIINDLLTMTIPHMAAELPRSLALKDKFKAAEWRFFLFYTSLPILHKYMEDTRYVDHWAKLSAALRTFCGNVIVFDECEDKPPGVLTFEQARQLLFEFVHDVPVLYSNEECNMYTHLLLHIPAQVVRFGPLWTTSTFDTHMFLALYGVGSNLVFFFLIAGCFPFESAMHWLLRQNHGKKTGFLHRFYRAYFENAMLSERLAKNRPALKDFSAVLDELELDGDPDADNLPRTYQPLDLRNLVQMKRRVCVVGKSREYRLGSDAELAWFDHAALHLPLLATPLCKGIRVWRFSRLMLDGALYTSKAFATKHEHRRDSRTFVFVDDYGQEQVAEAEEFFYCPATKEAFCVARLLLWNKESPLKHPALHSTLFFARSDLLGPIEAVNVVDIRRRLIRHSHPGLKWQGYPAIALSEFVYAVPGSGPVRVQHDQRQAREQM